MTDSIYAIGDIHGQLDKLRNVHAWIAEDAARAGTPDAAIVHVGDLMDRGPDSAGVLDYLHTGQKNGANWVVLKGNHDQIFAKFLRPEDPDDPDTPLVNRWLSPNIGGLATLRSYGIEVPDDDDLSALRTQARAAIPDTHLAFIDSLPLYHRTSGLFFVHAGIRPGVPLDAQAEHDLLWIRGEFHVDTRDHGALIIHGHTPVEQVIHYGNRVNIDTGAAWGHDLSAIVIEDNKVMQITAAGRIPVYHTGTSAP